MAKKDQTIEPIDDTFENVADAIVQQSSPPEGAPPTIPYSMFRGALYLGDLPIDCHVLNDGRRVITQREIVRVISGGRESGNLGAYLERIPNRNNELSTGAGIEFRIPGSPQIANGFEATFLIDVCNAYMEAKASLKPNQRHLAAQAEIVLRACAKVGIIALVDEATGYQEYRQKNALQVKLKAFISEEMQEWIKLFPDEFWYELARLENIEYNPRSRPLRWGKYVMMFVYDAIDEDVANELRKKNPDPHHGKNHHQWLRDHGKDLVKAQIWQNIGIMRTCRNMSDFRKKFSEIFKKVDSAQLNLDLDF